jgi:hypothetical protein
MCHHSSSKMCHHSSSAASSLKSNDAASKFPQVVAISPQQNIPLRQSTTCVQGVICNQGYDATGSAASHTKKTCHEPQHNARLCEPPMRLQYGYPGATGLCKTKTNLLQKKYYRQR